MGIERHPHEPGKRKTAFLTIDADNRDAGKRFLITEMPARQAEKWGYRLYLAINRGGGNLPDWMMLNGMASLPGIGPGALSFLSWTEAEPLIDELMGCVKSWPEGSPIARPLVSTDTEEVLTLMQLRLEVLALHVGFSLAAVLWMAAPTLAERMGLEKPPEPPAASTPPTSPTPSP